MRYALTYGTLSGLAILATILLGLTLTPRDGFFTSEYFGYLVMLIGLSMIFIGIKRYRDVEQGGVIRFWPALKMGLAIAVVAALIYVLCWEIYLASTGYRFMDDYVAGLAADRRAAGASEAEVAQYLASMDSMRELYRNPAARIGITFLEIFPVGLIVALFSAAVLRFPKVLPTRTAG